MIEGDRRLTPGGDLSKLSPNKRKKAAVKAMIQLRDKTIGITRAPTFGQTMRGALRAAGMDRDRDVRFVNARPEDNVATFYPGTWTPSLPG